LHTGVSRIGGPVNVLAFQGLVGCVFFRDFHDGQDFGHNGTDFNAVIYPWRTMANDGMVVTAAADGEIIDRIDGEFDQNCAFDTRPRLATMEQPSPLQLLALMYRAVWTLHRRLQLSEPLGSLDISFYRDDFTRIGMNPVVQPSELPFSIDDRHIILVDDVLHTGRTIRAALNELFDYGRPASILLAALIERDGRELPIEAAVVGQHVNLKPDEHIKLTGPSPLRLEIQQTA